MANNLSTLAGIVFFSFTARSSAVEVGAWSTVGGWFASWSTASSNSHASSSASTGKSSESSLSYSSVPRGSTVAYSGGRSSSSCFEAEGDGDAAFFFLLVMLDGLRRPGRRP